MTDDRPTRTAAGPQVPEGPPRADMGWLFGLLSALFAVSLILHQLWWDGFEVGSLHAVVVLAAFWALLRPASVGRFAAMAAAEVVAVAFDMPAVGSHTLLVLVVGASVLAHLAWTVARIRQIPAAAAVFEAIAPFLRVALLVVYAAAALAKMNTGFFDPAISCAASMSRQLAWFDPSLLDGTWRIEPAIWGTVAVEVALPVLLAVGRTRLLGLVVGGGFHTILALAGNVPFTAVAFAFYVVFLPPDTPQRLRTLLGAHPRLAGLAGLTQSTGPSRPRPGPQVLVLTVLVGGWLAGAAQAAADPAQVAALIGNGTRLIVVVTALIAGALLVASRWSAPNPPRYPARPLRVQHPALLVGVAVLIANGLCPYVGLKTSSSFEMFSNLRTEPGAWNHLFIPEAVRVFDYQDHLVRVVASNDPTLLARSARGTRLVRFELDRYLRLHPGTVATYRTQTPDGPATRTTGPLAPGPTPAQRIATFRDVPPPGHGRC